MPRAGWSSPRLLVGGVGLVLIASCAAVGIGASHSDAARSVLTAPGASAAWLTNDISQAAHPSTPAERKAIEPTAPQAAAKPANKPACSAEMVLVGGACIDRFEAHLLEKQADGALASFPPYQRPVKGVKYIAASSSGTKPQGYISQVEAADACENAGKRLCSLKEWHRACTGPERRTYPYGASYQKGRCNVGKNHLLSIMHGASVGGWTYDNFNDPALNKADGFLALTGEYATCTSPEGVSDLVGNLHEWVADRVDDSLPKKLPLPAIISRRIGRHTGNGIFMGGFFSTLNQHGEGCNFTTAAHDPRYHDYSTGFRCCADAGAEP